MRPGVALISIGGKNVRNGSLTGADVKTGSLTSSDVKNHSLLARDFKTGQLRRGLPGAAGATVFAGSSGIGLVLFSCDEQPGAQDVQLQAQATGASVDVGTRSLALTEWQDLP